MLQHLSVENYALIESLKIDFSKGFTVITGETGAGKSILLGALSLILGNRADTQALLFKEKKCIVEGVFDARQLSLHSLLQENDIDEEQTLILRREISPNGKSRAFVNDTPVQLTVMKEIGAILLNIHSQHETITLNTSHFQMELVDSFVQDADLFLNYEKKYEEYTRCLKKRNSLIQEQTKMQGDLSYYEFLYKELEDMSLQAGEQEKMEEELNILQHAEQIKSILFSCTQIIQQEESGVDTLLASALGQLNKVSSLNGDLSTLYERCKSLSLELKDIGFELVKYNENIAFDPQKTALYMERLDGIYKLQNKHHLQTVEELIELKDKLELQICQIGNFQDEIDGLTRQIDELEYQLAQYADTLHRSRVEAAKMMETQIIANLSMLGMEHARLQIAVDLQSDFTPKGKDKITFLFNANIGGELRELSKMASGGELSRLMLALKAVIHKKQILPTILFDEIDTGVSGEIAGKVASMMQSMSQYMQVIAITHLPQIAAKANEHFRVSKKHNEDFTTSEIIRLNQEENLLVIASMLSGGTTTDAALEAAKELITH